MPDNPPPQHGFSARRLAPLGLLVAAGVAFMAAGGDHYVTFAALAEHRGWLCRLVARRGVVAALLYSVAYAVLVALSLPGGAVLTFAGGFLFGTWVGGMCAVIGATLGATALFLAVRAGLGPNTVGGLAPSAGPFLARLEAGFRAHAFSYLLALRLIPLFPFWLINLAPALAGVGLPTYLLATFIGIIPATFVYASLGNGFGKVVEAPDANVLFKPGVLLPILALGVLALVPVWYQRWRRKPSA